MSILAVNIQSTGYGKKNVLSNVAFEVAQGEIVALIGPNGAGKSTLLKSIMNMVPYRQGMVVSGGNNIFSLQTEEIVKQGISLVPQGNRIFGELSVRENLEIGGYLIKSKQDVEWKIGQLLGLFPDLKARIKESAGTLSGGEKQQLALARALMLNPKILLLDEPSLGLAPKLVTQAFILLKNIQSEFGTTMLIVEQKVVEVLHIASRVIAFRMGEIAFDGKPEEIKQGEMLKKIFLV